MEFIKAEEIVNMSNPGVVSRQLLNPDNSNSKRVTITEVHLEVDACQPRHIHEASEQIWYATKGCGKLFLADDVEKEFCAGDVVRFADNDVRTHFMDYHNCIIPYSTHILLQSKVKNCPTVAYNHFIYFGRSRYYCYHCWNRV